MEKDKESITLSSSDEVSDLSSLGHIIIHEDPLSPVESTASEPKNEVSDTNSCTGTNRAASTSEQWGGIDFLDQVKRVKGFFDQLYRSVSHLDQLHKY